MISLLILASIPSLSSAALAEQAPQAGQQSAQAQQNREFIMKNYPPGALKRGEQGRVAFQLTVEPDGSLGRCEVTESSGFAALDNETCELLVRNGKLKPVLNEDGRGIRATQTGFIVWQLPANSTVLASTTATTMEKPDEIICKRTRSTGSLIARTRQCLTKRQWLQAEQEAREAAERVVGKGNFQDSN